MAGFAYPYNPNADKQECIVRDESLLLSTNPNKWNCLIPAWAPFYRESLILIDVATGVELKEGLDFYLGHYSKEVNTLTKRRAYGSVMLIRPVTTAIKFKQYMTVGGAFNVRATDIRDYLAKQDLPDPRNEDWTAVAKYVRPVDPIEEPTDLLDAIAKDPPTRALNDIANKLAELNTEQSQQFGAIFTRIHQLGVKIRAYDLANHKYHNDSHRVTYQQLNALGKDETAVNALKAYGKTLAQLTALIRSMGITEANVDQYYDLLGGAFQGRLAFSGTSAQIQNELGTSIINFINGDIKILSNGSISLVADSDKNVKDEAMMASAGNNFLTVHSSGSGTDTDSGRYNSWYLIHVGNINNLLPLFDSSITPVLDLYVGDGTDTNLSGKGINTDPLTGYVTFPTASAVKAGMVRMSPSLYTMSDSYAATASDLQLLLDQLDDYVPGTRKVQGKALSSNITFTKTDIGLPKVDNTSPGQKQPSDAFKAAAANKATIGHTHDLTDGTLIGDAAAQKYGLVQLSSTAGSDVAKAATPKLAKSYKLLADNQETIGDSKIETKYVHVMEFATRATGAPIMSIVGSSLQVRAGLRFFFANSSRTTVLTTVALSTYPALTELGEGYVYIEPTTETDLKVTIGPKVEDSWDTGKTLIGKITMMPTPTVTPMPFVKLHNVVEVTEHINSKTAHGLGNNLRKLLGLDNLENKGLSDKVSFPTFLEVFNNWYRFSHGNTDTYPFNPAELSTWVYNAGTDRISNTTNSASFIGVVSNDTYGDYEFEAYVSSNNADDDYIGLCLAYYKDPVTGKEHTLNLLRVLGSQNTPDYDCMYSYNFSQRDNYLFRTAGSRKQIGWSTAGESRLYAKRTGNLILCRIYAFSALDATQALVDEYTIDLASDPRFAVFLGEARYGYCALSQANSTWRVTKRPDDDGRGYYASMKAVRDVRQACLDKTVIAKGTIAHGATIPLPAGFTRDQVAAIVVPKTFASQTTGIKAWRCSVDVNGVVTFQVTAGNGTVVNGTVDYYLVGSKP